MAGPAHASHSRVRLLRGQYRCPPGPSGCLRGRRPCDWPYGSQRTGAHKRAPVPRGVFLGHLTHVNGKRVARHAYGCQGPDGRYYFGGDRVMADADNSGYQVNDKVINDILDGKVLRAVPGLRAAFALDVAGTRSSWVEPMPFSLSPSPVVDSLAPGF
jgi:hypothetical protein